MFSKQSNLFEKPPLPILLIPKPKPLCRTKTIGRCCKRGETKTGAGHGEDAGTSINRRLHRTFLGNYFYKLMSSNGRLHGRYAWRI